VTTRVCCWWNPYNDFLSEAGKVWPRVKRGGRYEPPSARACRRRPRVRDPGVRSSPPPLAPGRLGVCSVRHRRTGDSRRAGPSSARRVGRSLPNLGPEDDDVACTRALGRELVRTDRPRSAAAPASGREDHSGGHDHPGMRRGKTTASQSSLATPLRRQRRNRRFLPGAHAHGPRAHRSPYANAILTTSEPSPPCPVK
jgi:hypothetical protein